MEWREQVFTRGGLTRKEWLRVNDRQLEAISAELHRRNPDGRRD
nr:hypothetical protein [Salmonella sp. 14]